MGLRDARQTANMSATRPKELLVLNLRLKLSMKISEMFTGNTYPKQNQQ
jgi:hypothetical protein